MNMILETERLRLRLMEQSDLEMLLLIFTDPVAMRYYPSVKTKKETAQWMDWNLDNYRKFKVGIWVAEEKKPNNAFIGVCGLVPQKIDGAVQMEIGYLVVREKWGNGYATEAALAVRDYGINNLQCDQLICLIDPGNESSKKVAKKIGMKFNKVARKWNRDLALYSVKSWLS